MEEFRIGVFEAENRVHRRWRTVEKRGGHWAAVAVLCDVKLDMIVRQGCGRHREVEFDHTDDVVSGDIV